MQHRSTTWVAGLGAALVGVPVIAGLTWVRSAGLSGAGPQASPVVRSLPEPVPQPVTRTSPGAQVAWLWLRVQGQRPSLVAFDPGGRQVARSSEFTAPGSAAVYGAWRSADGSSIVTAGSDRLTVYSAHDGTRQQTYTRMPGVIVGDAFSPDGRLLALLVSTGDLHLQVIDLQSGNLQSVAVAHDPSARLPGASGQLDKVVWGMPVFAPDSVHLYALTDWGGPLRLTAFTVRDGVPVQTGTAVSGKDRTDFPSCAGPAMAMKVVGAGTTLAAFCHFDGAVWLFDARTLNTAGTVQTHQGNPFWLSPIFTPDGRLLYLHQSPGHGDTMQVVDLATHRLLGPVPTPSDVDKAGPFAWLAGNAYAGGVASTVPVSPDGLELYSATADGVMVLRIPDLKPLARLAAGVKCDEVWISGDGRTLYATADDGSKLVVMHEDGSGVHTVSLPARAGGFLASEHG